MKKLIIKLLSYFGLTLLSSLKQMSEGASHVQGLQSEKINDLIARKRGLTLRLKEAIRYSKATGKVAEQKAEDCDFLVNYLEVLFQAEGRCFNGQYFAHAYQGRDQTNLLRILNQVRAERIEAQEAFDAEQSIPMQINQTQD